MLKFAGDCVEIAAIDRKAPAERRLTGVPLLRERGEDNEMVAAQAVARECVGDEGLPSLVRLAQKPARKAPDSLRRVI